MKIKTSFRALACLATLILTLSARADLPVIQSIQMETTNLVVNAQVPAGNVRVVLETRGRLGPGTWIPLAVQRGGGAGGTIAFRVSRNSEFAYFRVRADEAEQFPASFYAGPSSFDPEPVTELIGFWPASPNLGLHIVPITTFSPNAAVLNNAMAGNPIETRAVVESDIWRLDGDTLYFFNQNRGLQIIDVANPDHAVLRGSLNLPAVGEQMYLLSSNHVVLLTRSNCGFPENSEVLIVALSNNVPRLVATLPVTGTIVESRLVGTALYVATHAISPTPGGQVWESGTRIESFDLALPDAPITRSTLWYAGENNAVYATDTFLFAITQHPTISQQSIVNAIDITAANGAMNDYESITAAGRVADKFKLNWADGVLSIISEVFQDTRVTKLETFRLADPHSLSSLAIVKLGEVEVGHGESLFATRFDGARAYIVTFLQIDPLWIVDLSDPTNPTVSGELEVPGWSTYIHPMGDRLVTVGIEDNRTTVSLFDVSDPGAPGLLSRVPLGDDYSYSEANNDEKAFTVLEDAGLILLPVEGYTTNGHLSWVQLIDLATNTLALRGIIEHELVPRRATLHRDRIISFSATELLSVDATDRDIPQLSGQLELAWAVNRIFVSGEYLIQIATDHNAGDQATPTVRVASTATSHQILTELIFTNAPIVGATVRSNHLYVVQAHNGYGGSGTNPDSVPTFWLTIVDLSSLPTLSVLGQTVLATLPLGWGSELEAVWPKPDLLVWATGNNNYHPGFNLPTIPGQLGSLVSPGWFSPYPIQAVGATRLLAFNVGDAAAPMWVSEVNVATNGGTSFSKPFAAGGKVYLSHNEYHQMETTNTHVGTNVLLLGWSSRSQRSFLDVVDYADESEPTVRPPVNLSGPLKGISHNGEMLYTAGFHRISTNGNDGIKTFDASAYDGVAAYLVDSLSLSNLSLHRMLVSGTNLFLSFGQSATTTNLILPMLETWTLSGAGHFTKLGSVSLPGAASELVAHPGLLAAQVDGYGAMVFDDSNPAALRLIGENTGCLNFNLRHSDAARDGNLWLPLDDYGVAEIKLLP